MTGVQAGTAYIDVQGDFSALNKQIDAAVAPISGKFGKLGKAAAVGLAGVGVAAVAAGKALYDIGGQFDDAYDTIRVGTGKTGKQLKGLEGDFKAVVKSVPTDFGSASTAISQLNSRLGLTGRPLRAISTQVLELSRVTKTDLSTNIESVTRLFGDWGVKTKDQAGALNKLFRASQATNVPVSKLSDLMVKFGGPLRQLGFGFDQAAALAAKFQKEGVNTELVMGSLRIALGKMARQGVKDPQEALQKLTASIKNAGSAGEANKLALETFGARAGPDMAAAIREGRFEIGDLQETIAGGKDTILGASRDTQDFSEKWQLFKNRVLVGLEPLATRVFGAVGAAMDALPGIVDTVRGAFDRFKASLSGGEGGGFASKAAESFRQLKDAVVTAFNTIIAVGGALWRTFGDTIVDHLKDTVETVAGVLQGVITAFKGIVDIISGVLSGDWDKAWKGVQELFSGVWTAMAAIVEGAWEKVKTIVSLGVTAIGVIVKAAAGALLDLGKWIVGKIVEGIKAVGSRIAGAATWLWGQVKKFVELEIEGFKTIGRWVLNRLVEGIKTVGSFLSGVGNWLWGQVKKFIELEVEGFKKIGSWILNRLVEGVTTVGSFLSDVGGWIWGKIKGFIELEAKGFKKIGSWVIEKLVEGLKGGANLFVGFLNKIIGLINKIPGVDIPVIAKLASGGIIDSEGVQALATGGQIRRGVKLTHPTVLMGEEAPTHPEFVIPTNPAYRGRALNLTAQLLQDLGVPLEAARGGIIGYASGGVIGKASGILGDIGKAVGGVAKGVLDLPLKLIEKGASWIIDQLPNPADMLPDWLTGLGKFAISKVTDWVKNKVTGLVGSSEGGIGGGGGIVALGRRLQRMGYAVGEHPAFGGVHPVHTPNSYHYKGRALDVNADNFPGGEPAALDRLYAMLRKLPGVVELLWRVSGHYDHLHVAMAKGGVIGGDGASIAPFVGSYKNGGIVPRDGLAYVHQGETITPQQGVPSIRVFIGERELTDIVRVELSEHDRRQGAELRAGVLA